MNTLMAGEPRKHLITVEEYYRMAEVVLLAPDAHVELIEGEIIDMAPVGISHISVVDQLTRLFVRAAGDAAIVRIQSTIVLGTRSAPEPDLALLAPSPDYYRHAHALPQDMLLVIEVSDASLRHDRDVKVPLYARQGIPEAWVVDLRHGELLMYRSPRDGRYLEHSATAAPGITRLVALPGVAVDLSGLFQP
ncbi:MAG TPA: Uma2 family endonuclease [Steroidobacteraceae bacterium]|nr:Uma2 family endonuclease [Steroidobacteraceae bacterium]